MERKTEHKKPFSPEALAIFSAMVELENKSDSDEWPPPGKEWWKLHSALHRALECKPWQWPCVEYPDVIGPRPNPEGQARYRALQKALATENRAHSPRM
jgi:hypothetical protein